LLCDTLVFSYALWMIGLVNGLSGGSDEVAFLPINAPLLPLTPETALSIGPTILLGSFGLTQFIFAAIIFRRRELVKLKVEKV
jgi:hypothetical protein